jgi:DNA-binding MarR family transcriptional regulator
MPIKQHTNPEPGRSPGGDLITDLILLIFKANADFLEVGPLVARDPNISAVKWQILHTLSRQTKTAAQLGRELGLSRQGALWNVQALDDIGLVELKDNPDDRRAKFVALTAKGKRTLATITKLQYTWVNELAESFNIAEIEIALRVITKLRQDVLSSVGLQTDELSS